MNELKNLQAVGLTTLGQALRTAFDLLNLNRLVTGIDNYGQVGSNVKGNGFPGSFNFYFSPPPN